MIQGPISILLLTNPTLNIPPQAWQPIYLKLIDAPGSIKYNLMQQIQKNINITKLHQLRNSYDFNHGELSV